MSSLMKIHQLTVEYHAHKDACMDGQTTNVMIPATSVGGGIMMMIIIKQMVEKLIICWWQNHYR